MPGGAETFDLKPDFKIKLDGNDVPPQVLADVQGIRVFQSQRKASSVEIVLQNPAAKWSDADLFFTGREIEIELGVVGTTVPVFKGEITAWTTELDRDATSALVIRAMDRSHRLMRGTKTRTYVQKTAPQIAEQIAGDYGLSPQVASGGVQVPFRIQSNETDYKFLRRLADAEGYEFWIDGDHLHFDEPQMSSLESAATEYEYGKAIKSFQPFADFRAPAKKIEARAYDSNQRADTSSPVEDGAQLYTMTGGDFGGTVGSTALGESSRQLTDLPGSTQAETERMAKARLTQMGFSFLTGELEIHGDPKVSAGSVVKITRCGKWFSGTYYVIEANHFYDVAGYTTIAWLMRDKWGEKSPAQVEQEAVEGEGEGEGTLIFQKFVDQDNKPIPKVAYEIRDDGSGSRVGAGTTSEDGIVQKWVHGEGPFKVLAVGRGGLTPAGGTVSGRVTQDGTPVPRAQFKLRKDSDTGDEITSDNLRGVSENEYADGWWLTSDDGWYRFTDMPGGQYFVEVHDVDAGADAEGPEDVEHDPSLDTSHDDDFGRDDDPGRGREDDDEIGEGIILDGVFSSGDATLSFVPFKLHMDRADGPLCTPENLEGSTEMQPDGDHWVTGEDGKYHFEAMPPGKYFIEMVAADEEQPGALADDTVDVSGIFAAEADKLGEVPFRLHKGSEKGELVTQDKLGSATTECRWEGDRWISKDDGSYLFRKMPPGKYFVALVGEEEKEEEAAPATEVFGGIVEGPGDKPLKKWPFKLKRDGAEIDAGGLGGGTTKNEFKNGMWFTDASGGYRFEKLPEAEYTLEVMLPGGELKVIEEEPPEGSTESGERAETPDPLPTMSDEEPVSMEPDLETFTGIIEGPAGPLTDWPFVLKKDGEALDKNAFTGRSKNVFKDGFWRTNGEGMYTFEDLPQADYTIEVVLPGGKLRVIEETPPAGAVESGKRAPTPAPVKTTPDFEGMTGSDIPDDIPWTPPPDTEEKE